MEQRNLDLEIPLTEEQWDQIGRRAEALGPEEGGFVWDESNPEEIRVLLSDEEARGLWRDQVSDPELYGESRREVARIRYNDGRPYAELEALPSVQPPAVRTQEVTAMEAGQEKFVREKWHALLREAGLHFEFGHPSPEVE